MTIHKLNESFYKISGIPQELQEIKRMFTIKIPGAFFDPMVKRGLKPDSEVFYIEDLDGIVIPAGLVPFVAKFGLTIQTVPEYTEHEILEFIQTLDLPLTPYDFQTAMVVESIMNKTQLCLAATGCLDPKSEINVEISEESFELLKKIRK